MAIFAYPVVDVFWVAEAPCGALVTLFNALLRQARALVGA